MSLWDDYYENGIIPNIWKGITGQKSSDRNNDLNLEYQKERNAIEDARYEEETAYNRAFSEEERDYNRAFAENQRDYERALQQQIFEREDTAIERQASSLASLGINPASVNMNGLGAGQAVSPASAPASIGNPSASSRGGEALHREQYALNMAGPILDLINSVDNINTSGVQRDSIRAQTNYQNLINEAQAIENEFKRQELEEKIKNVQADTEEKKTTTEGKKTDNSRNKRVDEFQAKTGLTDMNNGGLQSVPNQAWVAEQIKTSEKKFEEQNDGFNPLEKTGKNLKNSFSIVGNALSNTIGKGAKHIYNFFTNNKKQYRTARSGRNW